MSHVVELQIDLGLNKTIRIYRDVQIARIPVIGDTVWDRAVVGVFLNIRDPHEEWSPADVVAQVQLHFPTDGCGTTTYNAKVRDLLAMGWKAENQDALRDFLGGV